MESEGAPARHFLIPRRYVVVIMLCFVAVSAVITRDCTLIAAQYFVDDMFANFTKDNRTDDDCMHLNDTRRPVFAFKKINMKRYHWNKKNYINLNTFFYLGYGLSHLPSGIVSDKYGAKHVIEASLVSMALTSMFTPFLIVQTHGSPTVVTIIRFFLGLCEGTLMPGAVSMIAHWVPRRERATLTTIGGCGVNIGVLISQGATEIIMMKSSDWTLPFYLYGGVTLGLLLVWHLLVYSNPHRDPHINPVERFYLDTEMSAIVDHKNKNIPICRILCTLDVWSLSVIIGAYILMYVYLIGHLRVYLSDVLKLHIGDRGIWTAIPFGVMIVTGFVMAIISDWAVNSGLVNVVMMRKVCTNIGCMGPAVYTLAASYAGCNRHLSVVMFIIATALMGSSLAGFRLIILEISPNYSGSVGAFCNSIGIILASFTQKFVAWVVPNGRLSEYVQLHWYFLAVVTVANFFFVVVCDGNLKSWNQPRRSNKPVTERS